MTVTRKTVALGSAAMLASAALAGTLTSGASAAPTATTPGWEHNHAQLTQLNNSGAAGNADVRSKQRRLHVEVDAHGLAAGLPHAQHIHFGKTARNECPSVRDDANVDFRLTTAEGVPAYGPVRVSLTTKGDTSPESVLAVPRYPTAPRGEVHYERSMRTDKAVARAIRRGDAVVVVHGVDYNGNGAYDFDSAGASELDGDLPAEATDPAMCGVLR